MLPPQLFIDQTAVTIVDEELRQRIIRVGQQDDTVVGVLKVLQGASAPPLRSSLRDWKEQDGIIRYKGKVYVPDNLDLRRDVTRSHHFPEPMGHLGIA